MPVSLSTTSHRSHLHACGGAWCWIAHIHVRIHMNLCILYECFVIFFILFHSSVWAVFAYYWFGMMAIRNNCDSFNVYLFVFNRPSIFCSLADRLVQYIIFSPFYVSISSFRLHSRFYVRPVCVTPSQRCVTIRAAHVQHTHYRKYIKIASIDQSQTLPITYFDVRFSFIFFSF